ncbi:AAA ATPase-like protein [Herbihabitans rhizosphaerae]|uniref:AAA ATPase-like protein n=1 Tax=Herbihabitans rhizosphaerae TaxID=1872711 RepID=A0A4Q7L5E0_9PSEU|nr:TIR domain-containing protein [Herbihabitans rhizosphaerae]RZS44456.1 AAA ATPase-like protein [Herbihabitans rhizosphaerae]
MIDYEGVVAVARWDVFLSYRRTDAAPAVALARGLERAGLRVFWDSNGIRPFQPISPAVLGELAESTAMVVYYSADYPSSNACQAELTAAFLAALRLDGPARRIFVVNPEAGADHVQPVELRDTRHARAPRSPDSLTALCARIAAEVAELDGPLGAVPTASGAATFVGRFTELWRLHALLHPEVAAMTAPGSGAPVVLLHGLAGIGKTALAAEYARRFASLFPGGILLRHNDFTVPEGSGERLVIIEGAAPPAGALAELAGHARVVVISRERTDLGMGSRLALDGLSTEDGMELLGASSTDIVEAVGGHPLALRELAGDVETSHHTLLRTPAEALPTTTVLLRESLARNDSRDWDVLRALAAVAPAALATGVLSADTTVTRLHRRSLVRTVDATRIAAHPLVALLLGAIDPDPSRAAAVRATTLRTVLADPRPSTSDRRAVEERKTAWRLQVELARRLATARLSEQDVPLADTVAALHTLFLRARALMRDAEPPAGEGSVPELALRIHTHLRPVLSRWHPLLDGHHATRPQHVDPRSHERAWAHHADLRASLRDLREPLTGVLAELAVITGSPHGLS